MSLLVCCAFSAARWGLRAGAPSAALPFRAFSSALGSEALLAPGSPATASSSGLAGGGGYLGTGHTQPEPAAGKYLLTGACGQLGSALLPFLRQRVGSENVIATDVKVISKVVDEGPWEYLDVTDKDSMTRLAMEHGVTHIIHLASLLSAVGERSPQLALRVNMAGIQNVLELAAQHGIRVFSPSTIAVYGHSSPKDECPNDTIMQPSTMYGITKVHTELLGQYYKDRYGVDFRSLRFPGIISMDTAGGGTTDWAVEALQAVKARAHYTCFLHEDMRLPMLYMPDALDAIWQLMHAPAARLTRTTYNAVGMSFGPRDLADAIRAIVPGYTLQCTPDFRNNIAKNWPTSIDDSLARQDWGWRPRYDMTAMLLDILQPEAVAAQRAMQLQARAQHVC